MPNYYPIMLDVRGRPAIVIGGDRVAAEKATNLHASGALVTVISPTFCPELLDLHDKHGVTLRTKTYEHGDLQGAFVVVAATTYDQETSQAIWAEAQENGQLVNIVDVPALCNFILPSILRRGQLTITVSTEGSSPALAKRIRQQLEDVFPAAYATYLQLAAIARAQIKQAGLSYEQRDDFFGDFFTTDILERLVKGDEIEALTALEGLLRRYNIDSSVTTIRDQLKEAETTYGNHDRTRT